MSREFPNGFSGLKLPYPFKEASLNVMLEFRSHLGGKRARRVRS